MRKDATIRMIGAASETCHDMLTETIRNGAAKILKAALDAEVDDFLARFQDRRGADGRLLVKRNGHHEERFVLTGIGAVQVKQPRVRDDRPAGEQARVRFSSSILPAYMRKTRTVDDLVPWLYLKGISSGAFNEALSVLLGREDCGLSANTVVRLKNVWTEEYEAWRTRSLKGKRYVYLWADGIYFNVRLSDDRPCVLVIVGALEDGTKELVAIEDGQRESEISWRHVLEDLKRRGLSDAPFVAVGDGALGFWKALSQVFPSTRVQRCWCHKTANVLNYLPKTLQTAAKLDLQAIWMASGKKDAEKALRHFEAVYGAKYPKATACLLKDQNELLAFYDFPAEHWVHLRTTNPIESTFATVRLRTNRTKGCGTVQATIAMAFKLCQSAEKHWRKLNGVQRLAEVTQLVKFVDGIRKAA